MIAVYLIHPRATHDHVGLIPQFLDENDPRPAREQFDENYAHGGGWRPMEKFTLNRKTGVLKYPGDSAFVPLAQITFRDEMIVIYQYGFVAIIQKDGEFECARMD